MTALSKARRGALAVIHGGPARYSNLTIIERVADTITRCVHHEPADWLITEGLARRTGDNVEITSAGIERWRQETAGVHA